MKTTLIVVLVCLALSWTVQARYVYEDLDGLDQREEEVRTVTSRSKYAPTPEAKVAAMICKPYFQACRLDAATKDEMGTCFRQFLSECLLKIKKSLQDMKKCVGDSGNNLEQVKECISEPM